MQGGPLFMGILSLLFLASMSLTVIYGKLVFAHTEGGDQLRQRITYIKSVGLFSLVFGILGQLVGMFSAFTAIEQIGGVSPTMLAAGLRISMITTLYGMIIFLISYAIWMFLDSRMGKIAE